MIGFGPMKWYTPGKSAGTGQAILSGALRPSLPVRAAGAGLPQIYAEYNRLSVFAASRLDHNPGPAKAAMFLGFEGRKVTTEQKFVSAKARLIAKRGGSGPDNARSRVMARFGQQ